MNLNLVQAIITFLRKLERIAVRMPLFLLFVQPKPSVILNLTFTYTSTPLCKNRYNMETDTRMTQKVERQRLETKAENNIVTAIERQTLTERQTERQTDQ